MCFSLLIASCFTALLKVTDGFLVVTYLGYLTTKQKRARKHNETMAIAAPPAVSQTYRSRSPSVAMYTTNDCGRKKKKRRRGRSGKTEPSRADTAYHNAFVPNFGKRAYQHPLSLMSNVTNSYDPRQVCQRYGGSVVRPRRLFRTSVCACAHRQGQKRRMHERVDSPQIKKKKNQSLRESVRERAGAHWRHTVTNSTCYTPAKPLCFAARERTTFPRVCS